ncbi:Rogdi leucine zipper containing protein-domain-containing protein [Sporodiniella umbellata]|nr:Rogdi leucine zipper containing protein-domain-containing protein [Sporodiniella umbellata]
MILDKEERATAMKERDWLLEDVIPDILYQSLDELVQSERWLTDADKVDSLPLTQNEAIKGLLVLNGWYINKAELSIYSVHQEGIFKTSIVPKTPYFLEQLQQTHHYIQLAIHLLRGFKKPVSKACIVELLEDVHNYVNRALHALDYPNPASLFPYKVCHPKCFVPPLKQDTVIEFCIQDVFITCNLYALDFTKHNKQDHTMVTYQDKQATVLHHVKTQTQSPTLTELKGSIQRVLELCQTHKQMLLQIKV